MYKNKKIGLVLGAGAAKGWAHIGVLQTLIDFGLKPDIICGTSMGALVGASYATGHLASLEKIARSLTKTRVLRYFDISFVGGGLIEGRWIADFFKGNLEDISIDKVTPEFGAVATELHSGRETWLTSGSIIDAVRASIAIPGLLTPIKLNGQWLVDGALVNPLPVSLCRALGADIIIGVSLSGDFISRPQRFAQSELTKMDQMAVRSNWLKWLSHGIPGGLVSRESSISKIGKNDDRDRPGYIDVVSEVFFIVTDFVARVRLAADPVDLLIVPRTENIGLMDFHRAEEAIRAGHQSVIHRQEEIDSIFNQNQLNQR